MPPSNGTPTIQGVVFDLDGLMFNTEIVFQRSGQELLARRGREFTPELQSQMMGRRAREAFHLLIETHGLDESVDDLLDESTEIFRGLLDDLLAPMPGLFELLDWIEMQPLKKGVATSSHRSYLEDILGRFDLAGRFHFLLTAEDVERGKPHPEIYLKAAQRLQIAPQQMLVLEDSEAGTRAAAAAEAVVVSVPHEHSRRHDFSGAAHVADRLDDPAVLSLLSPHRQPNATTAE